MATVCADMPVAFQPLDFPSRLVSANAAPTFTSSDLFTPSSPPRTTLPTIRRFVRPTYGKANTWGTATVSYAGVGPAAARVKEREKGSVSRSHRHYGTGCTNYHAPQQPYSVTELSLSQCRPCDQLLPKPLLINEVVRRRVKQEYPREAAFTSHISKFAVFPSAFASENDSGAEGLTPCTAENLQKLNTTLYCTTSYKEDYKNYFVHKENRKLSLQNLSPETKTGVLTGCHNDSSLESDNSATQSMDGENINGVGNPNETCNGTRNTAEVETVENTAAGVEDVASTSTLLDEHPSATEDDSDNDNTDNATHLPELPAQFRKICPKYTCLRSPTWSASVPACFFRRHQLLPSSIAVLPKGFRMSLEADEPEEDRPCSGGSATSDEDIAADDETKKMPAFQNNGQTNNLVSTGKYFRSLETSKAGGECSRTFQLPSVMVTDASPCTCYGRSGAKTALQSHRCSKEGTAPLSCLLTLSGSRIPHRLGLRFKAQAHARYHSLFPDRVPDLRESRRSGKKYFFCNYHASVFRG